MKSEFINCKNCAKDCCRYKDKNITPICISFNPAKITNYDRLISKTQEEMAEWLDNIDTAFEPETIVSQQGWLAWLKQEASEGGLKHGRRENALGHQATVLMDRARI